jgi:hypothetical protein
MRGGILGVVYLFIYEDEFDDAERAGWKLQ